MPEIDRNRTRLVRAAANLQPPRVVRWKDDGRAVPMVIRTVVILTLVILGARGARAIDVEFATRPVKREILALYDSRHEATPTQSRIHRLAEMPLNWLGYKVTFVDVNGVMPPPDSVQRYRGLVTWFNEPLADARKVLGWVDAATATGLRYACLGEIAPPEPPGSEPFVARILGRLGLTSTDQFVNVTHKARITTLNKDMAGFERPLDKALPEFRVVQAAGPDAKVHLAASLVETEGTVSSVLIATSSGGGYAADAFTIFYDATVDKARWILNPFAFFKQAFGDDRFPVPDVTTLSGRRMYLSHIDGDGWNNISEIEGYREAQTPASEVISKEIIEPYPDLPVSVGLIAGDALKEIGGSDAARLSAKKIFALPQVEVASHTYSHPFAWGFYDKYDRAAELKLVESASHPAASVMDHVRSFLYRVAGKSDEAETQGRYVAGGHALPRGYLKEPFDIATEVKRALEVSEELAPAGKKAAIYLWSGDTEPGEAIVKATRDAGVRNMNGGDTRFDAEFPSVFYVPPISRSAGNQRQIYAPNSNENTYTNNWLGPFYGQLMLSDTLKNTELPRRLKPFNLYYHMYSGEKPGALKAIKTFVDLARSSKVIPVKASEYAAIADDFFATEIQQVDATSWMIARRGTMQTVRIDDAEAIDLDDVKSTGVLGATRHGGALYVALDAAVEPAVVAIRQNAPLVGGFDKGAARLIESRWQISSQRREACGFAVAAVGFGSGEMVWQTNPGETFDVQVSRDGATLANSVITADAQGRLEAPLPVNAQTPVLVRFTCHAR
jgi:polysaccharide biosynthesis protein PelA